MAQILMLTPQLPYPPRQGTALRNWGILRGLAEAHRISLLSFAAADQQLIPAQELTERVERIAVVPQPDRSLGRRLRDVALSREPDLALRLASPAFAAQVEAWCEATQFDQLLVEGLELAPFIKNALSRQPALRVIFDAHNCEYLLQKRAAQADSRQPRRWLGALYSAVQWRRLYKLEQRICRESDLVIAVSEADASALRVLAPGLQPLLLPNGIDVSAYAAFAEAQDLRQPALVFTGSMSFQPNVDGVLWFTQQVLPAIRQAVPEAVFYIVGRNPHPRLDAIRELPGVIITGSVPDSRPYIRAAQVYVVPLLVGGGTRLKILEATAMGKAIVSTTLGAEGFTALEGAMCLTDTAAEFATACIRLLHDADMRATLGDRAHRFAEAYDWKTLLPPLLERLG